MASVFEKDVIETDSGLILREAEVEELFFVEMRKLQDNRQCAKSSMICNALRRAHGLKEGVVRVSLNNMLKTGKIKDMLGTLYFVLLIVLNLRLYCASGTLDQYWG